MSNKACPKCGKPVSDTLELCPNCGYRIKEHIVPVSKNEKKSGPSKNTGYIVAVIAIIGVILMFAFRAWLGGLIYFVAALISWNTLNGEYEANKSSSLPEYVLSCVREGDVPRKIMGLVLLLLPLVVVIASHRWIVVDTQRSVDAMFKDYYY